MNSLSAAILSGDAQTKYDIVDAHAHVGPYSRFYIPQNDVNAMVQVMDRTGVRTTVLSSHRAIQAEAHIGNTATLRAVDAYPERFRGYLVVNPWQAPDAQISRLENDGRFVGIKIHPDLHRYPATGARYRSVWEYADRTGCPVLTHSWAGSEFDDPGMFRGIADDYPDSRILVGHSGASPHGFDLSVAVADDHPQLFLEICGSQFSGAVLTWMVETLGENRLVFGSDFPFIDQRMSLGRVAFATLSESARRSVLGTTARTLFDWREREKTSIVA